MAVPVFALTAASADGCSFARVDTPLTTGTSIVPVDAGDLDGDGRADLVVGHRLIQDASGERQGASALLGRGDGTFDQILLNYPDFSARSVLLIDINHDGRLDAVTHYVAADGGGEVLVLLGHGGGMFGAPIRVPGPDAPRTVAAADMNGDGELDLVASNGDLPGLYIIRGAGDGTFADPRFFPDVTGLGLAVKDVDGDGRPDVVKMRPSTMLAVHINDGAGGLRPGATYPIGASGREVVLADVTADSRPDALVACPEDWSVRVLRGRGDGSFAAPVRWSVAAGPRNLAVARLNSDPFLDVITVSSEDSSVSVLFGLPGGAFRRGPERIAVGEGASTLAIGDLTGDRSPDIVTGNPGDGSVTALIAE